MPFYLAQKNRILLIHVIKKQKAMRQVTDYTQDDALPSDSCIHLHARRCCTTGAGDSTRATLLQGTAVTE